MKRNREGAREGLGESSGQARVTPRGGDVERGLWPSKKASAEPLENPRPKADQQRNRVSWEPFRPSAQVPTVIGGEPLAGGVGWISKPGLPCIGHLHPLS